MRICARCFVVVFAVVVGPSGPADATKYHETRGCRESLIGRTTDGWQYVVHRYCERRIGVTSFSSGRLPSLMLPSTASSEVRRHDIRSGRRTVLCHSGTSRSCPFKAKKVAKLPAVRKLKLRPVAAPKKARAPRCSQGQSIVLGRTQSRYVVRLVQGKKRRTLGTVFIVPEPGPVRYELAATYWSGDCRSLIVRIEARWGNEHATVSATISKNVIYAGFRVVPASSKPRKVRR